MGAKWVVDLRTNQCSNVRLKLLLLIDRRGTGSCWPWRTGTKIFVSLSPSFGKAFCFHCATVWTLNPVSMTRLIGTTCTVLFSHCFLWALLINPSSNSFSASLNCPCPMSAQSVCCPVFLSSLCRFWVFLQVKSTVVSRRKQRMSFDPKKVCLWSTLFRATVCFTFMHYL